MDFTGSSVVAERVPSTAVDSVVTAELRALLARYPRIHRPASVSQEIFSHVSQ